MTVAELIEQLKTLPPDTLLSVWDCGADREAEVAPVTRWWTTVDDRLVIESGAFL